LQRHTEEAEELLRDLLIGVTSFFRDRDAFTTLAEQALPQIIPNHERRALRIWVVGCATGEEAYSIAMLVHEHLRKRNLTPSVTIFATDIDERAIGVARKGVYPDSISGDLSEERLERYFDHADQHYQIKKVIRDMLVFSVQNLLTDPPFTNIDLISCRNVLIYLNQNVQNRVVPLFHYSLRDGGLLFLGNSETVRTHPELFDTLHKNERIFVRNADASTARQIFDGGFRPGTSRSGREMDRHYHQSVRAKVEGYLLEEWTPTAVFVNSKNEVEFFHGRTGRVLEPPRGVPSADVVKMAREGLHGPLKRLLQRAATTTDAVVEQNVRVRENGSYIRVDLTIVPLSERQGLRGMTAILFDHMRSDSEQEDGSSREQGAADAKPNRPSIRDSSASELRDELQMTRERLQSTIDELETSNEELKSSIEEYQSTNEELQSSNEELESSKEEMQSLNEELSTVNAELKEKNDELERSYNEMQNFLDLLDSPIIFVDEQLRVKRFTKASAQIISLNEVDIGRSITDINLNLTYTNLIPDMKQVIEDSHEIVRSVETTDGKRYVMRIRSYTDIDRVRTGLLLLFHQQ
ncbi:MAG: CheR family methyltransferase, partial [Spirochaetota bacterium]